MHIRSGPVTLMAGTLLLFVMLLLVAGCTNQSSQPTTTSPTPVYTPKTTILIGSARVNPQILVIQRTVTVTWLNIDIGRHIITSDNGDPDSFTSPLLDTNHRFQITFTVPGTYTYHCADNPAIKGTIIVNN